jgi:hypothetical protein
VKEVVKWREEVSNAVREREMVLAWFPPLQPHFAFSRLATRTPTVPHRTNRLVTRSIATHRADTVGGRGVEGGGGEVYRRTKWRVDSFWML